MVAAMAVVVWLAAGGHNPSAVSEPAKPATKTGSLTKLPRSITDKHGTMLLVAAGPFVFGDDSPESPNRKQRIELGAFYVDATEVSNAQYADFVTATGRKPPSATYRNAPTLPVTQVTLADAKAYCASAGLRLPTEQEWEKAARGTEGAIYPWGDTPLGGPGKLVPVDEYPERQSPSGALNMAGNVFEWTTTSFPVTERELEDMRNITGRQTASEWFCVKGGSFLVEDERFFRSYMRRGWPVDQGAPAIGFRCVKDAK
jgi:formylglycine-generating enzyme required for sulfatase activity